MRDPMPYIMLGATLLLVVAMVLMLARLIGGPSLYDRLLAVNSFGTKTVLFLCVFCFIIDRPDGIDIALLYALMNFIATIAVLKFFNYGALTVDLRDVDTAREAPDAEGPP
ncbi:monovalent cation/H+ antiporter complex subunit F [uncultured Algimonas sp.]|uniref:monovalent cation/H+ antiporter complex subunit F n=1 Tax=uncultured Algimonas sp. TaxID=1547920 RepID=UPI00262B0283|nr:monovalent cation/H+ antiporter complex subunit F [uncultured Algimonas sp.]